MVKPVPRIILAVAAAVALLAAVPARAQCYGWPVTCTGVPRPGSAGGAGAGSALDALGIGLTVYGVINQMNQKPAPAGAAPAARSGSYDIGPLWDSALGSPPDVPLTLQQKSALLGQMRSPRGGSYATAEPSAPAITAEFAQTKVALLRQMRPLHANPVLDGPEEAASRSARVPFDTAGGRPAHSAADQLCQAAGAGPGCIGTRNAPVPGSPSQAVDIGVGKLTTPIQFPPIPTGEPITPTRTALAAESEKLRVDACTQVTQLQRRLKGYQQALARLQKTASNAEADRSDWERRWTETGNDALRQLPGHLIFALDYHMDLKLKDLNGKIQRALNSRVNATEHSLRRKYDSEFGKLEDQKRIILRDKKKVLRRLSDASDTLETWDLAHRRDSGEKVLDGLHQLLDMSLGDETVQEFLRIDPGYGTGLGLAELLIDAGYDVSSEYASWQALGSLNAGSDRYLNDVGRLKRKITDTVGAIGRARKALRDERRSVRVCAMRA